MKTIIAGSRTVVDYGILLEAVVQAPFVITTVVSGGARGADKLGELYAAAARLPLHVYPADWKNYGRKAGFIRNIEMAQNAEALIAVWDGVSRGTKHMIEEAKKHGLTVYVYEPQ